VGTESKRKSGWRAAVGRDTGISTVTRVSFICVNPFFGEWPIRNCPFLQTIPNAQGGFYFHTMEYEAPQVVWTQSKTGFKIQRARETAVKGTSRVRHLILEVELRAANQELAFGSMLLLRLFLCRSRA
jgi:hypothetical protein